MLAVQWVSTSVTAVKTRLSFMMTCLNKLLLTVKFHCFYVVHQVVKHILVTYSIYTAVYLNVLLVYLLTTLRNSLTVKLKAKLVH
ncbi:hypothetical protein SDC9_148661 [bioreactor metagenome]|uniref:Uncharacterized protein n=1 Tax=bioreactor metagenome TaxID=1076179 RepID=A0A645EJJ9_9ZZZZ